MAHRASPTVQENVEEVPTPQDSVRTPTASPPVDLHVFSLTLPIIHGFLLATCSNTCIFQGPVGSPIEVEAKFIDSTEPPPTDIVLSLQQQTEFQKDSPVTSKNPASPPPLDANVADENASANIQTPDYIRLIKHRSHVEDLKNATNSSFVD